MGHRAKGPIGRGPHGRSRSIVGRRLMTLTSLLQHTVDDWHDKSLEGFLKHGLVVYLLVVVTERGRLVERGCRQVELLRKDRREISEGKVGPRSPCQDGGPLLIVCITTVRNRNKEFGCAPRELTQGEWPCIDICQTRRVSVIVRSEAVK